MLDKTYRPGEVEPRLYEAWERSGAFAARRGFKRAALYHHDAAAQRHRQPAYGPCAELHPAGHPDPLSPHARARRAVAAGHRPCRHRHPDGGRAPARRREQRPATISAARSSSSGSGTGRPNRAAPSPASCVAWAPRRTGRASASPWTKACRRRCARCSSSFTSEGLIYRDKRLVNWDPKLHTAISDLEVEQREIKGSLWHLRYPVEGEAGPFIMVATTRPETMLGDTAVAVHPDDERYQASGRQDACVLPHRRPPDPDRRRRLCRPGEGHRRGQDHAGPRLQRLRGRPAPQPADDQHLRPRRQAQRERARRTIAGSTASTRARRSSPIRSAGPAEKIEPTRS